MKVLGSKFYLLDRRGGSLLDSWPADDRIPLSKCGELEQRETPDYKFARFHFEPSALAPSPGLLIEKTGKAVMLSGVGTGVTMLPQDAVIVGATRDTVVVRIGRYKLVGYAKADGSIRFEHVFPKNRSLTREFVTLAGSVVEFSSTGEVFERSPADFSEVGRWSFFEKIPQIQPPEFYYPFLIFRSDSLVFGLNKGDYHAHIVSLAYDGLRERYRWDLETSLFNDSVYLDNHILVAGSNEFMWLDVDKGRVSWKLAIDGGYFPDLFLGGDQFIVVGAADIKAVAFPSGKKQWSFSPKPEHYFPEGRSEYSVTCHASAIEDLQVSLQTVRFRYVEREDMYSLVK